MLTSHRIGAYEERRTRARSSRRNNRVQMILEKPAAEGDEIFKGAVVQGDRQPSSVSAMNLFTRTFV